MSDEPTKRALKVAYDAGYALPTVQWDVDATDEQRTPGVHHCPFAADRNPEEREAWLTGLKDALEAPAKADPATIVKAINDEIKVASRAGKAKA